MTVAAFPTERSSTKSIARVCCLCERVRTPSGEWEVRFLPRDEVVSHGICRACFLAYYPEIPVPAELK